MKRGSNPQNTMNYIISAFAGSNGSISPSGATSVASGANQTFTITPNTGYKISDVLVDGTSVGAVATYAFTNVTAIHDIVASFALVESVYPYALTTVARMKDRLQITTTDRDAAIIRVVNASTDLIERACGKSGLERFPNDGHFVQKTYVNEVYSIHGSKQIHLPLRNAPVTYLIVTGNLTAGSSVVTGVSPAIGIVAGMPLYAAQGLFPQNTSVLSVSGSTVTMSANALVTLSGAMFEISGLIKFEWRAGTPDSPSWTGFFPPQYELDQQGYSGIVRVYGPMPGIYSNMVRATYVAGYPVDWGNAGNGSTHQLPADLTNTCENIAVRILKRMPLDGKASENIQGATTAWRNNLDQMDLDTINRYTRVAMVF